jgi:hypothetical protein
MSLCSHSVATVTDATNIGKLRIRICAMMATDDLPSDPPVDSREERAARKGRSTKHRPEPDPTASSFWTGGLVVRVLASCDALWKQVSHETP